MHDDLVERQFTAEVKLYLCEINDVFSNRIIGYSIDSRMKARTAVNALQMAIAHRVTPEVVVVYSDPEAQHTVPRAGGVGSSDLDPLRPRCR